MAKPRKRSCWIWIAPTFLCTGSKKSGSSRLLRALLLSAAVRRLWRVCAVRTFAAVEYRWSQRQRGGAGTYCGADPASVAAGADYCARRFGLLSRRVTELVRRTWGGLCGGHSAKCPPAAGDRGGQRTSGEPISAKWNRGAGVHRVCLSNQKQLVAATPGDCQGGTLVDRGQSTVRGHLVEPARNHPTRPTPLGGAELV